MWLRLFKLCGEYSRKTIQLIEFNLLLFKKCFRSIWVQFQVIHYHIYHVSAKWRRWGRSSSWRFVQWWLSWLGHGQRFIDDLRCLHAHSWRVIFDDQMRLWWPPWCIDAFCCHHLKFLLNFWWDGQDWIKIFHYYFI